MKNAENHTSRRRGIEATKADLLPGEEVERTDSEGAVGLALSRFAREAPAARLRSCHLDRAEYIIVIQRRDDFGEPRENFNRDWADYKNGFGDPAKELWMGNEEHIHADQQRGLYAQDRAGGFRRKQEFFVEGVNKAEEERARKAADVEMFAQYSHFKIYSEGEYYKLEIDGYDGNAGDSLNDPWYGSNNSPFSTYNRDNDRSSLNCASMLKGGWWWKSCGRGLNGLYLNDPQDLTARQGIVWFRWRGWDYTLKKAVMMIKPRGIIGTTTS
uniref:Fibrinogen C-terminal domain-containing protein n=1 Tax=Timema cristinae TaxID=61476 RepID=A0A7R9CNB9_TIMCR|nr:unnamed protein product [Timema cristinae]